MWGQVNNRLYSSPLNRIIPTRVGTRRAYRLTDYRRWDHPHACGDKSIVDGQTSGNSGSSPRVWGQVIFEASEIRRARIIPTRVGTRTYAEQLAAQKKDHPHACGDKLIKKVKSANPKGSSPRVWGQVITLQPFTPAIRIIPTRVGTRAKRLILRFVLGDHPHACGDKLESEVKKRED